jgi:hypothetical protein
VIHPVVGVGQEAKALDRGDVLNANLEAFGWNSRIEVYWPYRTFADMGRWKFLLYDIYFDGKFQVTGRLDVLRSSLREAKTRNIDGIGWCLEFVFDHPHLWRERNDGDRTPQDRTDPRFRLIYWLVPSKQNAPLATTVPLDVVLIWFEGSEGEFVRPYCWIPENLDPSNPRQTQIQKVGPLHYSGYDRCMGNLKSGSSGRILSALMVLTCDYRGVETDSFRFVHSPPGFLDRMADDIDAVQVVKGLCRHENGWVRDASKTLTRLVEAKNVLQFLPPIEGDETKGERGER